MTLWKGIFSGDEETGLAGGSPLPDMTASRLRAQTQGPAFDLLRAGRRSKTSERLRSATDGASRPL